MREQCLITAQECMKCSPGPCSHRRKVNTEMKPCPFCGGMEQEGGMSRLTMQEVIEHCEKTVKRIEKEHERHRNWLELEPMPIRTKQYWEHKQTAEWLKELQHYKDLEEQGRLIELPCKVGDTVYIVPSKFSYRENCVMGANNLNKINEDRIDLIKVYEFGYSVGTFGGYIFRDKNYRETWFIAKDEAEARLTELKGTEE